MRFDRAVIAFLLIVLAVATAVRGDPGPYWSLAVLSGLVWWGMTGGALALPPSDKDVRPIVLIPTHNNAKTVGEVAAAALAHGIPVLVIDDGSHDGSGDAARSAGADVVVHAVNRGKGQALLTGMEAANRRGFTHAICLDADAQHDPADIPAFAAACVREPDAIWAGVRDLSTAPGISNFGRNFSNFWVWFETGWRVSDTQCGFRAYPILPVLSLGLGGSRYDLEVEVLTRCLWSGVAVRDLPCRVFYPDPKDRVSSFNPLWDNVRISWMNTKLVLEKAVNPSLWLPARARATRWSGDTRGAILGWKIVLGMLKFTGRKPAYAFVSLLAIWYMIFAPDARNATSKWLALTGIPGLSTYRVFRNFAHTIVDRFAYLLWGQSAFQYEREGIELLQDVFFAGTGAIILGSHLGNLEVNASATGSIERIRRLKVLRFVSSTDHGQRLFEAMPGLWRPEAIAVNQTEGFAALAVVRALRSGQVVAMHGDRRVDDRTTKVRFMGRECLFPTGPWMLAALAQVPVFLVGCFKVGPNNYRVVVRPPLFPKFDRQLSKAEQLQQWTQVYASQLEDWAKLYPEQWYNFFDFFEENPPSNVKAAD